MKHRRQKAKGGRQATALLLLACFCFSLSASEFKQAVEPRAFQFPQDHASHPGYQTEWWYATGNVKDSSGKEFGYQFTLFRRAVDPQSAAERGRRSAWAMDDFYVGHAAISDLSNKKFYCEELYARGSAGISGATKIDEVKDASSPIRVWLNDWEIIRTANGWTIKARFGSNAMDLQLTESAPFFLNGKSGEEGLSRKGPKAGQASYYYSVPGLQTRGTLTVNGVKHEIAGGLSWLDREWGSNQLSEKQAGWDWFSLQFDDGSALMLYYLRYKDGTVEPASSGTFVTKDGTRTHIALDEMQFKRGRSWTSPFSGGQYTLGWTIEIPKLKLALNIDARQDDQEVKSNRFSKIYYYEGSIKADGTRDGKTVKGDGYLEITGPPGQEERGGRGIGGLL
jgi:predicted secreted hydrolase